MTEKPLIRIVDDDEALRDALSYTVESEHWESAAFLDAESFLAGDRAQECSFWTSKCRA